MISSASTIAMDGIDPFPVSVVLVSYRTGQALFSCLEALRQEESLKEILLVDNGNEEEVLARLRQWSDPRLRLITGHGNIGFAAGCHKGAAASRGAFLLFLNPDCLLARGAVTALLGALVTQSNPWIATVRLLDADGREQRGCRRAKGSPLQFLIEGLGLGSFLPRLRLNYHANPLPKAPIRVPAISGAFMLMPRTTWERSGGFDPGYFLHLEDLDLCARLRAIDGACWFLATPACIHIKSTSAASGWRVEVHKLAGFWRYFRRWYPHPWGWRASIWLILALGIMIRTIAKNGFLPARRDL